MALSAPGIIACVGGAWVGGGACAPPCAIPLRGGIIGAPPGGMAAGGGIAGGGGAAPAGGAC